MMKKSIFLTAMAVFPTIGSICFGQPLLRSDNIDEIIAAMTVEEKVALCTGNGTFWDVKDALDGFPGAPGGTVGIPRLGIPTIYFADGPLGLKISETRKFDSHKYSCTAPPVPLLYASSWDRQAAYDIGKIIGNECFEYGISVILGPSFNIQRNPLCGRFHEYYSEDPLLSGILAAESVRGTQSENVGTSLKHFAVNSQETNRKGNDARISQRALREIYLKPFEIAVRQSDPWTVMSSYNKINGTYAPESRELLGDILRGDWGFKGMVMTDWNGGEDAVAMMAAGNDLIEPGTPEYRRAIIEAVESGRLPETVLDANVRRILEMVVKTPVFKGYTPSNRPDLESHAQQIRKIAAESMILLKNDDALPLTPESKIALYGCTGYDLKAGGIGYKEYSGPNYVVSMVEGFRGAGFAVDRGLINSYTSYLKEDKKNVVAKAGDNEMLAKLVLLSHVPEEMPVARSEIESQAAVNDAAVIVLGQNSGEAVDRTAAEFHLTEKELSLIRDVTAAYKAVGKKTVVVLNVCGTIETASWKEFPDAILCAYQPGEQAGNSIADVLSGRVNPSGKLTVTFPVTLEDMPSTANFPVETTSRGITGMMAFVQGQDGQSKVKEPEKNVDYTDYLEDIYVGYRYFDTFGKEVCYPFGYGLSYTIFDYSNSSVISGKKDYTVRITVTNTGDVEGKEVVQVYACAPYMPAGVPAQQLVAFGKTKLLAPGESQQLVMSFTERNLAWYDSSRSAWVLNAGEYGINISASSRDVKAQHSLLVRKEKILETTRNRLAPQVALNLLRP